MKVLLVVKSKFMESLGVMYLKSVIQHDCQHECIITDLASAEKVAEKWQPEIVGFSIMTGDMERFRDLNMKLQTHPVIIVGGPDPTFFPEGYDWADTIIKGEAEQAMADLLQTGQKYDGIDSLPWPARDDFPNMKVRDFISSRGCPYKCLTGDTLILMEDLSIKEIKDVCEGDKIIGIKENTGKRIKIVSSQVQKIWKTKKPVYEIELENGMTVRCSGDHRWLTDRGWKYTAKPEVGQRPYLTTNNKIRIFGNIQKTNSETECFMKGYLSGMIRGDGHLAIHGPYPLPSGNGSYYQHQFRLCLKDKEPLTRVVEYLNHFGVNVHSMVFSADMDGIRTSSKVNYNTITELIEWCNEEEFYRGFLSGIYDAEGGLNSQCIRISNNNKKILAFIERALKHYNFKYIYDVDNKNGTRTMRILGGRSEIVRFIQVIDPAIKRKRNLLGANLNHNCKIKRITYKWGGSEEMYDIQTTTRNFIANGMVSHNCSYCYNAQWAELFPEQKGVRTRDVNDVVAEISDTVKNHKAEYVYFQDSCFGVNMGWMEEFSNLYREKVNLPWQCNFRPEQITEHRADLLKASNCVAVRMALESASNRLRGLIGRTNIKLKTVREAAWILKDYGIQLMLQNIIGLPTSTIEDDLFTLEQNILYKPTYAWVSIFQPYPGTALGNQCKEEGWYSGDYSDITDSFFETSHLMIDHYYREQLEVLQKVFALCADKGYLPKPDELTYENLPKLIHKVMRKDCDRKLYVGLL